MHTGLQNLVYVIMVHNSLRKNIIFYGFTDLFILQADETGLCLLGSVLCLKRQNCDCHHSVSQIFTGHSIRSDNTCYLIQCFLIHILPTKLFPLIKPYISNNYPDR